MKFENLEIRTNSFKKSPPRKKDGLYQLKIRVYIGSNDHGKVRNRITLEIKVVDESSKQVFVSADEFNNRKSNKKLNLVILKTESKISDTVGKMIEGNVKLTSENLFKYLYKNFKVKKTEDADDAEMENNQRKIRQHEGIQLAKINGVYNGRVNGAESNPSVLMNKYQNILDLLDKSDLSVRRIAGITGHSINTVRKIKQLKRV